MNDACSVPLRAIQWPDWAIRITRKARDMLSKQRGGATGRYNPILSCNLSPSNHLAVEKDPHLTSFVR